MKYITYICKAGIIILLLATQGFAQNLLNHISRATLSPQQQLYLRFTEEEQNSKILGISSVNIRNLKKEHFDLNLPNGEQYQLKVKETKFIAGGQFLTKGNLEGIDGEFHMIQRRDMLTGHINVNGSIYTIRPLGKGMHAILELDMSNEEICGNSEVQSNSNSFSGPTKEEIQKHLPDSYRDYNFSEPESRRNDGGCRIRVLVVYTKTVRERVADPLSLVHLAIELTNTGYANSGIHHRLELAGAYETDFEEYEDQKINLERFTGFYDRQMTEVHFIRRGLSADMCHLLTTTGSGIAWVDNSFEKTFAVTNYTYIGGYTFGHETGHNHKANHDPSDYDGSSYARGYGNPDGLFRTVMAYPEACGTDPCPRVNEFSGPNNYYSHPVLDTSFVTGTSKHDNVRRHNMSASKIANHYTNPIFGRYGDLIISNNEAMHFRGIEALQNTSTDGPFTYKAGAEGSFKAGKFILLKPGFLAQKGSEFIAALDECSNDLRLSLNEQEAESGQNPNTDERLPAKLLFKSLSGLHVYPNPFSNIANIEFDLNNEQNVSLYIRNAMGQIVSKPIQKVHKYAGKHQVQFQAKGLSSGIYFCILTVGDQQYVKKMVLVK